MATLPVGTLVVLALLATGTHSIVYFPSSGPVPSPLAPSAMPVTHYNHSRLFTAWSHLTGPSYALKLLRLSPANITSVFSPLAFKLTIQALASVSNPLTESAVNELLFDQPEPSVLDQPFTKEALDQAVLKMVNKTLEATQGLTGKGLVEHLSTLVKPLIGSSVDHNLELCSKFKNGSLKSLGKIYSHVEVDCMRYLSGVGLDGKGHSSQLQLTPQEEIKLCHAFSIQNFYTCVDSFHDKPENHLLNAAPALTPFTPADVGFRLNQLFHDSNETISPYNSFLHRLSFISTEHTNLGLFLNMSAWFGLENFQVDPSNMAPWNTFVSTHNFGPNTPVPEPNCLLNIVQFEQKVAKSFATIGQHVFYGPANASLPTEMLYKQDTYAWIAHGAEEMPTPNLNVSHVLVKIPFQDQKYSLVLIVPKIGSTVPEMLADITADQLTFYLKKLQLEEREIKLTIPKFSISGSFDFTPLLKRSNLSEFELTRVSANVTEPVVVSGRLTQKVNVVNWGLVESGWSRFYQNYYGWVGKQRSVESLIVDRPFVYLVTGRYVDLNIKPAFDILVAGTYYGPGQSQPTPAY